nr:retrotransposon protein, putative, Ty1-copia subclass [Tanacetum cinerariifolium]
MEAQRFNVETLVLGSQNNKFDSKLENGGVVYKVFDDMPKQNFGVVYKVNEEMPHGNISSVKDYYDTFYSIYTDSQLSPEHGLSCFLDGLKEEIQGMVRLFKPQTLREAYYLAKIHELTLNKTKPKDPTRTVKLPTPSIQKFKNPEELHKSANFHAINTKFQAYLQSHAHKRIRSEEMLNAEISITLMENNDENNVGSTMGINTKDLEDIQEVECSEENEELELESEAQTPFQYEENLYHKFGTSWDPILERQVVMESKETIEFEKIWLEVFIKAGMGGYTGNVSASRVGEIAKEAGILKDIKELELNDVKEHGMVVEASLIKDKILRQPSSNFIVVSETFEWKPGLKSCSFERWRKIQHDLNEHGVVHMLRTRSLMLRAELHLKCDYGSLKWRYLGRKFKSSRRGVVKRVKARAHQAMFCYNLGSVGNSFQENLKVLFGLNNKILKGEKEWKAYDIHISLPTSQVNNGKLNFCILLNYDADVGDIKYNMHNSKKGYLPMEVKHDLSNELCALTPEEVAYMKKVPYASAVGSIMYAVRCTRPDVAFAQNLVSRYQQNPKKLHWVAVKHILKYLRNMRDMFLVYGGKPNTELDVTVDWKSKKQTTIAMHSVQVEYVAASEAAMKAVWIRKFVGSWSARYFLRRYHYVREQVKTGEIKLIKVHTDVNLADPFTKALPRGMVIDHAKGIGLQLASSFMHTCD